MENSNQTIERRTYTLQNEENETSLVSLVKTLIYRKGWFISIFFIVFLASCVVGYLKSRSQFNDTRKWTYTSYIAVPYKAVFGNQPLSAVATVIQEIYAFREGDSFPIEVEYNYDTSGNIVKIITKTSSENMEEITSYHKKLISPLLESKKENYNSPLFLKTTEESRYSTLFPNIIVLDIAVRKPNVLPVSRWTPGFITSIAFSQAFLWAIFGVFLIEFISNVYRAIQDEKKIL
ncbi:hypothetical protein LEP1GSC021_4887 [Leptospira noguchii str. 1993005606]|uniref:hypothetical protein n=1 Tax=Leptospira noguchii TaxID=28182 RepID=UPI0003532148|nr:hypothetical protein [Leptospira noguchii]EPE82153.1 hypothetical protein LEP1GSC021_4887 [Leptospira noguchii str. 1993005606]